MDIPAALSVMLADHLNRFGNHFGSGSLVFTTENGTPVRQSAFRQRVFTPAAKRAGVEPVPRVHDLRHTARRSWVGPVTRCWKRQNSSGTRPRP